MSQGTNLHGQVLRSVVSGPLREVTASRPRWPASLPPLAGIWGAQEVKTLFAGTEVPVRQSEELMQTLDPRSTLSRSLFPELVRAVAAPVKKTDSRIMVSDPRDKASRDLERYKFLVSDGWKEGPSLDPFALAAAGMEKVSLVEILDRIESVGVPTRAVIRRHYREEALTDWVIMVKQSE